jgi:plasmid stabilization system protein ParE
MRNALTVVASIRDAVSRLPRFPESGRRLPESPDTGYREVIASPYRIVYRYQANEDRVLIIAIIHGRRSMPVLSDG